MKVFICSKFYLHFLRILLYAFYDCFIIFYPHTLIRITNLIALHLFVFYWLFLDELITFFLKLFSWYFLCNVLPAVNVKKNIPLFSFSHINYFIVAFLCCTDKGMGLILISIVIVPFYVLFLIQSTCESDEISG